MGRFTGAIKGGHVLLPMLKYRGGLVEDWLEVLKYSPELVEARVKQSLAGDETQPECWCCPSFAVPKRFGAV